MHYKIITIVFSLFLIVFFSKAQNDKRTYLPELKNASVANGKKLFRGNCAKCHEVCDQKLGPPLIDIMKKRPIPWLVSFIQNSSKVISSGDPYAQHLFSAYNQMEMPSFTELKKNEVLDILKYLEKESDPNRRDTVIKNTEEVSALISSARNRTYTEERGEVNYYNSETTKRIAVDQASILNGKGLFQSHCQSCHEICATKIGPALAGISKRRPLPWLLQFINNPVEVVKTEDNYSNYLISNYNFIMPSFDYVKVEDQLDILAYIRSESSSEVSASGVNSKEIAEKPQDIDSKRADQTPSDQNKVGDHKSKTPFKWGMGLLVFALFGIMAFFLNKYRRRNR